MRLARMHFDHTLTFVDSGSIKQRYVTVRHENLKSAHYKLSECEGFVSVSYTMLTGTNHEAIYRTSDIIGPIRIETYEVQK